MTQRVRRIAKRVLGFALIELAVVLAIVGVLVGAVMSGQYLIRQSEVQSTISDFGKFKGAYQAFYDQYGVPPGDMADATDYWGTDPNGCPTNNVQTPRKETCNGNGDGQIGSVDGGVTMSEPFRAFQHLSNQGLIAGTYSGVSGTAGIYDSKPGVNVPTAPANAGYGFWTVPAITGNSSTTYFDMPPTTLVQYGASGSGGQTTKPALTPREAMNIDSKIDDGSPATGNLVSYKSTVNPGCTTLDTSAARYSLTKKDILCALAYKVASDYSNCESGSSCEGTDWVTRKCDGTVLSSVPDTDGSRGCLNVVNGVCGSNGTCSPGTASGYSAGSCGGSQTWSCVGANGGSTASCSTPNGACPAPPAPVPPAPVPPDPTPPVTPPGPSCSPVNGSCGSIAGVCNSGSFTNYSAGGCSPSDHTEYSYWTCAGSCGGSSDSCSAATSACPPGPTPPPPPSCVPNCSGTGCTPSCDGTTLIRTDNCGNITSSEPNNSNCMPTPPPPPPAPTSCSTPYGTIANGGTVCGWTSSNVNMGCDFCTMQCSGMEWSQIPSCTMQCGECDNGVWSGSPGPYSSCHETHPPCCFIGEARITMADGSTKRIADLKIGDKVKGHTRINTVTRTPDFDTDGHLYGFNGRKPVVTGGHPFWTTKGWKAFDPALTPKEGHNVKTTRLHIGDILQLDDGSYIKIKSIETLESMVRHVYSPTVDGDHTYYSDGVLVHNKCMDCSGGYTS